MADSSERTEQPTPKRLEKARKEGQFPVSPEFLSAAYFGACIVLLLVFSDRWTLALIEIMRQGLAAGTEWDGGQGSLLVMMRQAGTQHAVPMLTAGVAAAIAALLFQLLQTRFGIASAKLKPDWGRLNPSQKVKGILQRGAMQFVYALVLLPAMGFVVYSAIHGEWASIHSLPRQDLVGGIRWAAGWSRSLLITMAALFGLVGFVDFHWQSRKYNKSLRMSKQEIKDEMRESDGNPLIKARLRKLQRGLLRRKMVQDVPKATLVVVNPTHYAVALRYAPGESAAPRVLAKGRDHLALRIRKIAMEHQVPVVENPPLARSLYQSSKVGHDIPPQLYRAVAEVLAYIYRVMQGRTTR